MGRYKNKTRKFNPTKRRGEEEKKKKNGEYSRGDESRINLERRRHGRGGQKEGKKVTYIQQNKIRLN
jgi:hypothetical protein